ncbi:hypothetical protein FACS1894172_17890 [Spirochaetia bacterium]|nr:hypothetical protein FACS1894164_15100 [Spirochaetia bacterium]GHU35724.1 hypothetical protein FACS1894172_17890 [Spirochaetia bacterium]
MELGHDTAMKIWERDYGNAQEALDYAGRRMVKSAYGQTTSEVGWDIDHKTPVSKGGSNEMANLRAVNIKTNRERGNK